MHGEYGVHRECMESMEYMDSAWRVWSTWIMHGEHEVHG